MIEVGNRYRSKGVVTEEMTAKAVGSGDLPVLATPVMIALMEKIDAFAGEKKIGTAHHIRYVVDRERFLSKLPTFMP